MNWTLAIAVYAAVVSSILGFWQLWLDRRRLRIIVTPMVWVDRDILELLRVRAVCEGRRPVHVQQAGVVTESGDVFHPGYVVPPGDEHPGNPMLTDGESVVFYFDPLSFEDEGYLPKAVWVEDVGGRMYKKRLGRKKRRAIALQIADLRKRLGSDVSSQGFWQPVTGRLSASDTTE